MTASPRREINEWKMGWLAVIGGFRKKAAELMGCLEKEGGDPKILQVSHRKGTQSIISRCFFVGLPLSLRHDMSGVLIFHLSNTGGQPSKETGEKQISNPRPETFLKVWDGQPVNNETSDLFYVQKSMPSSRDLCFFFRWSLLTVSLFFF